MKLKALALAAGLLALGAQNSFASLSSDQRLADFNQLVDTILRNYGPLQLKAQTIGLKFDQDVADYKAKIAAAQSDGDFYQLLTSFLATLNDAHVSAEVPSTYKASLGFTVDRIGGKVLIDSIDRLKLPEQLFPFQRGDQLLSIDGTPVDQIVSQLAQLDNTGYSESTLRIATYRLVSRKQAVGFTVPKGIALLSVLPRGAAQPVLVTATWINAGTPFLSLDDLLNLSGETVSGLAFASNGSELLKQLQKLDMFQSVLPASLLDDLQRGGVADLGSNTSMFKLPDGAQLLEGIPMTAAIYQAAGKKIGVLRIPSYEDPDGKEGTILAQITKAVAVMQANTDVLVLDQTNNPGGSVSLVSDIVGLFADKSYIDMNFKVRPSLNWLNKIKGINDKLAAMLAADPNDAAANALQARFQFLDQELRDSIVQKRFLTSPISLNLSGTFGVIQPNKDVRYTKPVLLLINDLDFSGGDAFPAIMQDNGRVKTFGSRTSGAGGNVAEYGPLVNSYFKFHLTESLMVRPNGKYVENTGVSADLPYEITEDDYMNGYRGYVKAFTVEALKLAGSSPADIDTFQAQQ